MSTTDNPKHIVMTDSEWTELTSDLDYGVSCCGCPESMALRDAVLELRGRQGRLNPDLEHELPVLIDSYQDPDNEHPTSASLQKLRDKLRFATRS